MNFQMFELDLGKAEEEEIKLPAPVGSQKKQDSSRKTSISVSLTVLKHLTVWITTNCEKFLEIGVPDQFTCFLRHKYACQGATVRPEHGTANWFQIGKRVRHDCILSPCLFNLYAEYIMRNAGLDETQAGIKISGTSINNLRYIWLTPPLWQKVKRN